MKFMDVLTFAVMKLKSNEINNYTITRMASLAKGSDSRCVKQLTITKGTMLADVIYTEDFNDNNSKLKMLNCDICFMSNDDFNGLHKQIFRKNITVAALNKFIEEL